MHLDRLVLVLETVSVAGRPVSAADIQRATHLPKPTCYRLVQALSDQGLVDSPGEDGRFVIGQRLSRIALMGRSDADISDVTAPLLRATANRLNETVFLARLRKSSVEIVHVETPKHAVRSYIHPGLGQRPLHACSCAKAIAAYADPEFRDHVLKGNLTPFTENTLTNETELRAELAQITKDGFAQCDQEIDIGIASVAAPVALGRLGTALSVGAIGPIRRFDETVRERTGGHHIQVAKEITGTIQLNTAA